MSPILVDGITISKYNVNLIYLPLLSYTRSLWNSSEEPDAYIMYNILIVNHACDLLIFKRICIYQTRAFYHSTLSTVFVLQPIFAKNVSASNYPTINLSNYHKGQNIIFLFTR